MPTPEEVYYTHALWRVKPGQQAAFKAAWKELADIFAHLPNPPIRGTLLQSLTQEELFYSFGPWHRLADIEAMRADGEVLKAFAKLKTCCTETQPSAYRVIEDIRLQQSEPNAEELV